MDHVAGRRVVFVRLDLVGLEVGVAAVDVDVRVVAGGCVAEVVGIGNGCWYKRGLNQCCWRDCS